MAFSRGNLESLTQKHIVPRLADAVFKGNPFCYWLRENHSIKLKGGRNIVLPLMIREGNASWYDSTDNSTLEILEPFNSAQANWHWIEAPAALAETDIDKNGGEDGVIDLLNATKEWIEETLIENLSDALFGSNSSNSKQVPGLQDMFAATGTSYLDLLDTDVDDFTGAKWLTQILAALLSANALSAHDMKILRSTATRGQSKPNLGLCNFPVYNKIWALAETDQRFGMEKLARIGFDHVMFENMPIMPDEHAPGSGYGNTDNWLMFLNMDAVQFFIHENKAFVTRVYDPLPQQNVWITKVMLGCTLTTNRRRDHSVSKTINPSS